ncbi:SGNH hydrolase-type esterase domain-containing protein, partial [Tanacetum coccineum]
MTKFSGSLFYVRCFVILLVLWSGSLYANGCYTSIISFGDSLTDTGNAKQVESIIHQQYSCSNTPYGDTFFHEPTGRCSDGRLIIDFLGVDRDGARTLVVPGNFPIGCSSLLLALSGSPKTEYDPTTGCNIEFNEFIEYHDDLLQMKLNQIREYHPDVNVIYADYYNASMQIYRSPDKFGFTSGALKACCGSASAECGSASATMCDQPNTYVSWDGLHLTEAAYKLVFKNIFQGPYTTPHLYANGCYTSIISFGDSLADTGNLKQLASISGQVFPAFLPPYGETFFHEPTGRCSDGRLIIDFLAESLGLPLIPPYQQIKGGDSVAEFGQGVNYAVEGATALTSAFYEERGIQNLATNASLGVQLAWFKQSLHYFCSNASDCRNLIGRSLILMGEIGGNDYNTPIHQGKPMDEVKSYVPLVIDTIASAINELTEMGAQTLIVPGNLPMGCSLAYLTEFNSEDEKHDPTTSCLVRFNEFAKYHNRLLQTKLNEIRELHPNVTIIYADYYNAAMEIYLSPDKFGLTNGALKACCGGGGPYNYNPSARCGFASATVCDQPDTYVNWDGVHLTEAAYKQIFKGLFQGSYTAPQFTSLCPTTSQLVVGLSSSMCVLTQKALDAFCDKFHIPEEVHPVLPNQNDIMHDRPVRKIGLYTRDPDPVAADFNAQDYATLVAHPSLFRKFPEAFLCLVGLSLHYTLDEETYPRFLHNNGEEMDIFAFIHATDPTKVKIVEQEQNEGEPLLLETTIGRNVPLLLVAPDRVESKLEASVDGLFDEGGSGNQTEQGDSASGGEGADVQPVSEPADTVVKDVAPLQPRRQRKRKT